MMIVRVASGKKRAAVILALTGRRMRVALKDTDDVMEYKLVDQTWISEDSLFSLWSLRTEGHHPPLSPRSSSL